MLDLGLQIDFPLPTVLYLAIEGCIVGLELLELVHASLQSLLIELLVLLVFSLQRLVLVLHFQESLTHLIVIVSHLRHLFPHLVGVNRLIQVLFGIKVDLIIVKASIWVSEVFVAILLRDLEIKPLVNSRSRLSPSIVATGPLNASVARVLIGFILLVMIKENLVLVGDPRGHVTYLSNYLFTVAYELTLVITACLSIQSHFLVIIIHHLDLALVEMQLLILRVSDCKQHVILLQLSIGWQC